MAKRELGRSRFIVIGVQFILAAEANTTTVVKRKALGLALTGLVLALAAPVGYMCLLDIPMFRSSGLPAWALLALGLVCAVVAAVRDTRLRVRLTSGGVFLFAMAFVVGFFVLTAVPAATTLSELETAPDFTLPDHNNTSVSLRDVRATGPVLLVFYRGHW